MEKRNEPDNRRKCPICRKRYDGFGHNALPVWPGRCCDRCNRDYVIPMRLRLMQQQMEKEKGGEGGEDATSADPGDPLLFLMGMLFFKN